MLYADLTVNNSAFLKRFSHTQRFRVALKLLAVDVHDKVLDYGTGDGFMLIQILEQNPQPKFVVGYEPMESQYVQLQQVIGKISTDRVAIIRDLNQLEPSTKFDKISCLEVLEHLTVENQRNALCTIRSVLNENGFAVVSVPIEIGISGLMKNFARIVLRQQHPNSTAINILKSFLGVGVERGNESYISTHIGFDYRDLEKLFVSSGFEIKNRLYSPLKGCGSICNSQVFYVLSKA